MAKKQKTLKDKDLRELISDIGFTAATISQFANDESQLNLVMTHTDFKLKLFDAIAENKKLALEINQRFNAPVHYEDDGE